MINQINYFKTMAIVAVLSGLLALGGGLVLGQTVEHRAETTAVIGSGFSFQGVLEEGGAPLSDQCDMQFSLWDAAEAGSQIGGSQTLTDVAVHKGLFTVLLNDAAQFGSSAFSGAARWLEIGVWCDEEETEFTILSPRQPLTAVPYAHTLRPGAAIVAETGTALTVGTIATNASSMIINGSSPNSAFPSLRVNNDGSGGYGFYVNKTNGAGVASFGANNGATGSGTAGYSANWYGVYGYTGAANHNYGFYSPDNLYTRNISMAGAMMMVAQNNSQSSIETGDVAAFTGIGDGAATDGQPIIQVGLATAQNATAVAGVVYGRFPQELLNAPPEGLDDPSLINYDRTAPIAPGDYLLLVVYGPAQVKSSGMTTGIQPGDRLTFGEAALTPAHAAPANGAVFGKALESTAPDKPLLYVFVTLQ
jgi:hypothetical protein